MYNNTVASHPGLPSSGFLRAHDVASRGILNSFQKYLRSEGLHLENHALESATTIEAETQPRFPRLKRAEKNQFFPTTPRSLLFTIWLQDYALFLSYFPEVVSYAFLC